MTTLFPARWFVLTATVLVVVAGPLSAQPTYKLDVRPHLKPAATLSVVEGMVRRSAVTDDPGFRLQFHVKKADGSTLTQVEARSSPVLTLPATTPAGTYSVVLELFHPAYKGGTAAKGEYKTIAGPLGIKVEPPAANGGPLRLTAIELPMKTPEPTPKK